MFEMFLTIMAALIAAIYGISQSVFMNGPHRNYYRLGLLAVIIIIYVLYKIHHTARRRHLERLHVEPEGYVYYEKYTSLLYRAGYLISYFIQNILFDYIYMWRNFNFCKGLDVYDGGVGDYYIKFRHTWYRYLKLTRYRHKVSLKKLQGYAADVKNRMIEEALPTEEEKEMYQAFSETAKKYFDEHHTLNKKVLKSFPSYNSIDWYYRKNILRNYKAIICVRKYQPMIMEMVRQKDAWSQKDINEFRKKEF